LDNALPPGWKPLFVNINDQTNEVSGLSRLAQLVMRNSGHLILWNADTFPSLYGICVCVWERERERERERESENKSSNMSCFTALHFLKSSFLFSH
jgi:hypothetical protein